MCLADVRVNSTNKIDSLGDNQDTGALYVERLSTLVVWCDVEWCSMTWCGVAWHDVGSMVWRSMTWFGVAWYGVV